MDNRLQLNEKQKEIVARYNSIVREMEDAKIIGVYMEYEGIAVINGENVIDHTFPEDGYKENNVYVEHAKAEHIDCPFGLRLWLEDGGFNVCLN